MISKLKTSKNIKYLIVMFITMLIFSGNLYCQTNDSTESKISQSKIIDQLEKKNQALIKQKSDIVDVLKWSIGSILIIIIALLTSSVYFNFRLSSKEVENINKGIELEIKNFKIDLEKEISLKNELIEKSSKENIDNLKTTFINLEKELKSKIDKDNTKLLEGFQNQLDEFNNNYRQQISTIEKSLSSQLNTSNNYVKQLEKTLLEKINKNSISINDNHNYVIDLIERVKKSITASIERNAGYMWEAKGVLSNALGAYRRECQIHVQLENDFMISLSLDSLIKIAEKSDKISDYDREETERLLNILPPKYDDAKENLRKILEEKQ